jgi:hypothetical protein
MARKEKVDNALLKRFARQDSKRKQDIRTKRRYFLIVCEGTKTEPNYFNGLKKCLLPGVVDVEIIGTGHNTMTVIEDAQSVRRRREEFSGRTFDEVWAVFDRDCFPPEHFNNAISKGQAVKIYCAWTNKAFELWYLLHFDLYENGMSRADYKGKLDSQLSLKMGQSYRYHKNSKDMFQVLSEHGDVKQAIIRARQLETVFVGRTDYANHNPSTKVYELVEELLFLEVNQ